MWSVTDWRSDEMFLQLDNREQGIYRNLIDECWMRGFISSDLTTLAQISREPVEYFTGLWAKISYKFHPVESGHRLIHPRLEEDRTRLKGIRRSRARSAAEGNAEKRRRREASAKARGTHSETQWHAMLILSDFQCVRCHYRPLKLAKDHIVP